MTLKQKLDNIYSKYIRLKNADKNGYCECISCGVKKPWKEMQNGHFIPRNHLAVRYYDDNCHPQCYRCNCLLKGNYILYTINLQKKFGNERVEMLTYLKNNTLKLRKSDYENLIKHYTDKVNKMLEDMQ